MLRATLLFLPILLLCTCAHAQSNTQLIGELQIGRTATFNYQDGGPSAEISVGLTRRFSPAFSWIVSGGLSARRFEDFPRGDFRSIEPFVNGIRIVDTRDIPSVLTSQTRAFFGGGLETERGRWAFGWQLRASYILGSRFDITRTRIFISNPAPTTTLNNVVGVGEEFFEDARVYTVHYRTRLQLRHQLAVNYGLSPRLAIGLRYVGGLTRAPLQKTLARFCDTCMAEAGRVEYEQGSAIGDFRLALRVGL